jgi:hypothetical protein
MRPTLRRTTCTLLLLAAAACHSEGSTKSAGPEHLARTSRALSIQPALSATGTEQCTALNGSSFTPALVVLANAKAAALSATQAYPGADIQGVPAAIDEITQPLNTMAQAIVANGLDGTNPSNAESTETVTAQSLQPILAAAKLAATTAAATGSSDARSAYESLLHAAGLLNDLTARAGRCVLDKDTSWWDWTKGVAPGSAAAAPPAVPSSCSEIGPQVLDPLDALLASAIASEQASIAANPGPYNGYGQYDINAANNNRQVIAALRSQLSTSGLTAADPATALAIETALPSPGR